MSSFNPWNVSFFSSLYRLKKRNVPDMCSMIFYSFFPPQFWHCYYVLEFKRRRQRQLQKTRIWLVEWGKIIVLHVRHAHYVQFFDVIRQTMKIWNLRLSRQPEPTAENFVSLPLYESRSCQSSERALFLRAVFKWLSKIITRLRLLRLVIGLKESRQFFNQWEAKPKPIAPCTRDFSRASSELQVIARNCDWFIALFVPVVIGRSNCFGLGF